MQSQVTIKRPYPADPFCDREVRVDGNFCGWARLASSREQRLYGSRWVYTDGSTDADGVRRYRETLYHTLRDLREVLAAL